MAPVPIVDFLGLISQITSIFFSSNKTANVVTLIPAHPDHRVSINLETLLSANPWAWTQITRPQFLEGIIRMAMAKYPQLPSADALKNFVAFYLKPSALKPIESNAFRAKLIEVPVQQIFEQFHHPLLTLYEKYESGKVNGFKWEVWLIAISLHSCWWQVWHGISSV